MCLENIEKIIILPSELLAFAQNHKKNDSGLYAVYNDDSI